jgi:hypothetical protein
MRSRRSTSWRQPRASVDAQSVLQPIGAVEEESLLRICDMVVDSDTAGALSSSRSSPSRDRIWDSW